MQKKNQTGEQAVGEMMKWERDEKAERFRYLNRYVKKGQILFTGSSLMEQFPIYEFLQDFELPFKIYNRGIGGYTTTDLLNHMEECIFELEPGAVFLNIGSNDLNEEELDMEGFLFRYEKILEQIQIRLPATKIFLIGYYPVNPEVSEKNPWIHAVLKYRTNQRIIEVNRQIEKLAEKFHAGYFEGNEELMDEKGNLKAEYTIEGMHMFANGYEPILQKMIPILQEVTK